jgi:hypothetical protein
MQIPVRLSCSYTRPLYTAGKNPYTVFWFLFIETEKFREMKGGIT